MTRLMSKSSKSARQLAQPMYLHVHTPLRVGVMLLLGLTVIAISAGLHAQTVYRIVGTDGKVSFSDRAPISADSKATNAQTGASVTQSNPALPYDLQQVVGKYPVILYTSNACSPCNAGRNLLMLRGVPFTERTISTAEDSTALQQLSGNTTLPFATIGRQQLQGYSDTEWIQYLDVAGYPAASKLPTSYRNPLPAPLVAAVKAAPKADKMEKATGENAARSAGAQRAPSADSSPSNPAGIRF